MSFDIEYINNCCMCVLPTTKYFITTPFEENKENTFHKDQTYLFKVRYVKKLHSDDDVPSTFINVMIYRVFFIDGLYKDFREEEFDKCFKRIDFTVNGL